MAKIPDLQSTNVLDESDEIILRQDGVDKRIKLDLSDKLSWCKQNEKQYKGEYRSGVLLTEGDVLFHEGVAWEAVSTPYTTSDGVPTGSNDSGNVNKSNTILSAGNLKVGVDSLYYQNLQLIRNLGEYRAGLKYSQKGDYATYNDQAIITKEDTTLPYTTQGSDPTDGPDEGLVIPFAGVTRSDIALNLASISDLLNVQPTSDGFKVNVTAYHEGWAATNDAPKGGGVFVWDSSRPKTDHNGGTIIDPDAPFPTLWGDTGQQAAWFDSANTGNGCYLITEGLITSASFGVIGDDSDETIPVQSAINSARNLRICKQSGSNILTGQITVPSDTIVDFDPGVRWKAVDTLDQNIDTNEVLFRISEVSNVVFNCSKCFMFMNKSAYSSEHNHGIAIYGSTNITINDPRIFNTGGDGIHISEYKVTTTPENIVINNPHLENNRRNGMSVVDGRRIFVNDGLAVANNGTTPNSGFHIEPEVRTKALDGIHFNNCHSRGHDGYGFYMNLTRMQTNNDNFNVSFSGSSTFDNVGLELENFTDDGLKGTVSADIVVNDPSSEAYKDINCIPNGIVRDVKITCSNPNSAGTASRNSAVLIGLYEGNQSCGGLNLDFLVKHNRSGGSISSDIYIEDRDSLVNEFSDIDINIKKQGSVSFDNYPVFVHVDNGKIKNVNVKNNYPQEIQMTSGDFDGTYLNVTPEMMVNGDIINGSTSNGFIRFVADQYPGQTVKVRMAQDGGVRIYPPAGFDIYPSNANYYSSDGYIILTKKGESFTLKVGDDNNLYIVEANSNSVA